MRRQERDPPLQRDRPVGPGQKHAGDDGNRDDLTLKNEVEHWRDVDVDGHRRHEQSRHNEETPVIHCRLRPSLHRVFRKHLVENILLAATHSLVSLSESWTLKSVVAPSLPFKTVRTIKFLRAFFKMSGESEDDESEFEPTWRSEGSEYLNRDVIRTILDTRETSQGRVVGWLGADESDFVDKHGKPAPLWRIHYHAGELKGDFEDLELTELLESLVPLNKKRKEPSPSSSTSLAKSVVPRRAAASKAMARGFVDTQNETISKTQRRRDVGTALVREAVLKVSMDLGSRWVKTKDVAQKCYKLLELGKAREILNDLKRGDDDEDYGDLEEDLKRSLNQSKVEEYVEELARTKRLSRRNGTVALPDKKHVAQNAAYDVALAGNEEEEDDAWPAWRERRVGARIRAVRGDSEDNLPKPEASSSSSAFHEKKEIVGEEAHGIKNSDLLSEVVSRVSQEVLAEISAESSSPSPSTFWSFGSASKKVATARSIHKADVQSSVVTAVMGDAAILNHDPARGWHRELKPRRSGDKSDCYYYPPCGTKQLRSRPEVGRYFDTFPEARKGVDNATGSEILLDVTDFKFGQGKPSAAELRRCRPFDHTKITYEINRRWETMSEEEKMSYEKRAREARDAAVAAELEAARRVRDRVRQAAIKEANSSYADALRAGLDVAAHHFPGVEWITLLTDETDDDVKNDLLRQHKAEGRNGDDENRLRFDDGLRRPRRRAANADYTDRPKTSTEIVAESLEEDERIDWPALAERVSGIEAEKQESRRCVAIDENPAKTIRESLAVLLRSFKARRRFADLTGDYEAWRQWRARTADEEVDFEASNLRRSKRTEAVLRALVLKVLSQNLPPPPSREDVDEGDADELESELFHRRLEVDGLLGVARLVSLDGVKKWVARLDDGQTRTFADEMELVRAIARCGQPELLWPELSNSIDPLMNKDIQVFWPLDSQFYEGRIVSVELGDEPLASRQQNTSNARLHLVFYPQDGSSEWLDLRFERIRFVDATRAHKDCVKILKQLNGADVHLLFCKPVNAELLGLADYHDVIERPMDLETILFKLRTGQYDGTPASSREATTVVDMSLDHVVATNIIVGVRADLKLTYQNAIRYNDDVPERRAVAHEARRMIQLSADLFSRISSVTGSKKVKPKATTIRGRRPAMKVQEDDDDDIDVDEDDGDDDDFEYKSVEEEDLEDEDDDDDSYEEESKRKNNNVQRRRPASVLLSDTKKHAVEKIFSFEQLLATVPIVSDVDQFSHPPGINLTQVTVRSRKVNHYEKGDTVFVGRASLEREHFETSHAGPSPYLGTVVGERWEIRHELARAALGHVLGSLVRTGHVVEVSDRDEGTGFVAAHLYSKGNPPVVERKQRVREEFKLPHSDLPKSEYELMREENVRRNNEYLKAMGLGA